MSKKKNNEPKIVMMGALVYEKDAQEFRDYCATIGANPHDIIYAFIRAVNNGDLHVNPARPAPFSS